MDIDLFSEDLMEAMGIHNPSPLIVDVYDKKWVAALKLYRVATGVVYLAVPHDSTLPAPVSLIIIPNDEYKRARKDLEARTKAAEEARKNKEPPP